MVEVPAAAPARAVRPAAARPLHRLLAILAHSQPTSTAMDGQWIEAPGHAFFEELTREHGELPFIAEDLGAVSQEVWDLRDEYDLPGMKVLQFAFGGDPGNRVHHPDEYPRSSVAFTGTHDSNTMLGWYRDLQRQAQSSDANAEADLERVQSYFGTSRDVEVVDAAIRRATRVPCRHRDRPASRSASPRRTAPNESARNHERQLDLEARARSAQSRSGEMDCEHSQRQPADFSRSKEVPVRGPPCDLLGESRHSWPPNLLG